jgi:hypothetical protein
MKSSSLCIKKIKIKIQFFRTDSFKLIILVQLQIFELFECIQSINSPIIDNFMYLVIYYLFCNLFELA